jgi:hypothetical protein
MKHLLVVILVLLIGLNLAQAQHKPGSSILLFNVGFVSTSPEYSDDDLSGNTFMFSYETSNLDGNMAGGVSIGYMSTSADSVAGEGSKVERANTVSFGVFPILLYGRYMFGSEKFKGYLGAGFGIQFSNATFATENVQGEAYDSGFLLSGMAGANYFISEKILINANYNISWLANSYFQDGIVSNFAIGLGFQLD